MISKEDARTIVGIIGNIIAFILFLSPMPTFVGIVKKRSVEQYSAVPYVATFVNCGLWVLYGLPLVHPHSTLVVSINGIGIMIEVVYLSLFLVFSEPGKRLRLVVIVGAECVFIGVLALLVLTLAHSTKIRSDIVGSVCMVGNIIMYASPLSVMKLVVTTRSVEYMPFFLSLFSFLNGISWTAYALIRFDPFIAVPNGMGALLGLAQLLLYATFYKSTKRIMAERKKTEGEVGLAQIKAQGAEKVGPDTQKNGHASNFNAV
ncbi:bidirectional sugar transporter sweet7 [Phtheirospermum japonicum]|uniref:Bidirectional sugar transporter SWEET n=1 Tax=Phtheirospermum japonicum TaxID=374723 RepID=A0A830CIJ6_9LAMI|nr:bidirectional sugar transporter sweet7 [Phtheirospermum japonicum]